MKDPILILGATGLGKVALEILQKNDFTVYGFLDNNTALHGTEIHYLPVLGGIEDPQYLSLLGRKCQAVVALEHGHQRKTLIQQLEKDAQISFLNNIHPQAILATHLTLGHGNFICPGVCFAPDVAVGSHNILRTQVIIEHDAQIRNFVHIGAGSTIGESVTIEDDVFIGTGVTVVAGITIGKGAKIGPGSVVIRNVEAGAVVLGNPATVV